jgi:hypothetical protein
VHCLALSRVEPATDQIDNIGNRDVCQYPDILLHWCPTRGLKAAAILRAAAKGLQQLPRKFKNPAPMQSRSQAQRVTSVIDTPPHRLLTSGSVEEDILERAKQKMVLDHLVIQRMDTSGRTVLGQSAAMASGKQLFGKDEMAAILRCMHCHCRGS